MRKIASNYIYWPGFPLVKNGYIEWGKDFQVRVVDTGGHISEIAGLEFYGGLIVPDFVCGCFDAFRSDELLLPVLDRCFSEHQGQIVKAAIIEGADLRTLTWKNGAHIRLL